MKFRHLFPSNCIISFLFFQFSFAANISPIKINLPISTLTLAPPQNIPQIHVSKEGIWLNKVKLDSYDNVVKIPDDEINPIILNLQTTLKESKQLENSSVKNQKSNSSRNILLRIDKEIPFNALFSILNTCANADYRNIYFATVQNISVSESAIKLILPDRATKPTDPNSKTLSISIIVSDSLIAINNQINSGPKPYFIKAGVFDTFHIDKATNNHFLRIKSCLDSIRARQRGQYSTSEVIIACDKLIGYQFIISVIENTYSAGFSNISISKLRGGSGSPGKRPRENILKTVMGNIGEIRSLYNDRLKVNSKLAGKILAKFAIDEFGKVISIKIDSSTVKDTTFEKQILFQVEKWHFGKVDAPGDVTEVIYPFVFNK
jgi:biopolymer transport protein ExbD